MMKRYLAALMVLLLTPIEPVLAEPLAWIDQAYQRLNREFGFTAPSSYVTWNGQSLNQGQMQTGTFVATSVTQVRLTAACDDDCNQLTVRLKDYRGEVLSEQTGNYGAVSTYAYVSPGQTYRFEVYPEDCSTSWCYIIYMVS